MFYCQSEFRVITGRILDDNGNPISANSAYEFASTQREAYGFYNFYTLAAGAVNISSLISNSDYQLINSMDQADVTSTAKSNSALLPAGFYQIRIIRGAVRLTYSNSFKDISYSF